VPTLDNELLPIGKITSPHGIKGWVKISTQTDPAENIFNYRPWRVKSKQGFIPIDVINWRVQGKGYVAQLKQIGDRNEAEALCPVDIYIEKQDLPKLAKGEYYWHQLEGCELTAEFEDQSFILGRVKNVMPTGANDVLVVEPSAQSIDDRERLIPYVLDQYVKEIDIDKQQIIVDWDPEF